MALYTAVIVEPRNHPALNLVLRNFNRNLDERWKFLIYHGNLNEEYVKTTVFDLNMDKRTTFVKLNITNMTINEYNLLLCSTLFYDNIYTEMFLVFQTDTLICDQYKDNIYKFMEYDYVGAPWFPELNVGNGGLSLRRKSKMLHILYTFYNKFPGCLPYWNEDVFFSSISERLILKNGLINLNKPTSKEAAEFSIETIYSENSFGLHKCWNYLSSDQMENVHKRFPELKLLIELQM